MIKKDQFLLGEVYSLISDAKHLVAEGFTFEEAYMILSEMDLGSQMLGAEHRGAGVTALGAIGSAAKGIAAAIVLFLGAGLAAGPEIAALMKKPGVEEQVKALQQDPQGKQKALETLKAANQARQVDVANTQR